MIAELASAMTAIKETAGLAKVFGEAKTDSEVKAATIELQSKLLTLQSECFSLGEAIRLKDEEVMQLKAKIAEFENFRSQVEGYVLNQLESGTFVYSKDEVVNEKYVTVHLCQLCYSKNIKSILHPIPVGKTSAFHESRCLHCENKYLMDRNSRYEAPMSFGEIGRVLNGDS
ncbi:hypothetical protein [Trabulsiella odontotermitis]|uniref:hypothetical protein n=1 Tax=Trabulsiella odontotermitis TaxID=379893 RepID=UPI0006BA2F92|nr:hypothetical protein [Trabulsiella odontotermitis]